MTEPSDEAALIEKLYEYGEQLNNAKDKSQNVRHYQGIIDATKTSVKAKQLAAQLIPRFFKFFPDLSGPALDAHIDLVEEEQELGVRVQAIRGLPLFCSDTPENIGTIIDNLVQILGSEEFVERDAAHKALMSLLRQDIKASLAALFKHIGVIEELSVDIGIREKVVNFIRDKVFPLKSELLKPQEEMERYITDLIKKSLEDVTGKQFWMFINFLKSLSLFGDRALPERMKELIGIIEGQADLDAQFNVSDAYHIDRLITCLHLALPFVVRGAPSSKFLTYINKFIIPVFDQLPEERKGDLLKVLAEFSPYTTPQDSRQILPSIVQLLKKYISWRKTGEEMNFTYVECLLYTFHLLAHKVPNATNSLCGYKIVTGQPSDRLGEDFSEHYQDFTERIMNIEEFTRTTMKKLNQVMVVHNKSMAAAKTEEAKEKIKYISWKKTGEEMNFTYVECLLYTFHHLAHMVPNATNSLCGYNIVTGQPSDRLGEDFSEHYQDFTGRLKNIEEFTRTTMKKLNQVMAVHNKSMAAAKTEEVKEKIKPQKQNTTTGLRTCNNILAMTKPLHSKAPSFIGDKSVNLSWKEATNTASSSTKAAGVKRPATLTNRSNNVAPKKGRDGGGLQNQLANRALQGLPTGGRSGGFRGRGSGGRGRGRGYL